MDGGDKMSIGTKLKELRGDKTQEQVANAIGVTKSAYAMYERDERVPRDEVKKRIANYYHTSVGIIFFAQ
jgi:transcriptional regulator with XRE-family HTH domain